MDKQQTTTHGLESLTDTMDSLDLSSPSQASGKSGEVPGLEATKEEPGGATKDLCCICQEKCVNPVKLPCSHIFCYLCIKGVAARNNRCALCRRRIPSGYLEDTQSVVNKEQLKRELEELKETKTTWFYEAKNGGWWMYEQRTSSEIEQAFSENKKSIRLQISGFFYIVDLESMVQYREDHPNRRRNIKRDVVRLDCVKGVAGIRTQEEQAKDSSATNTKASPS